jgi:hypothetical protein
MLRASEKAVQWTCHLHGYTNTTMAVTMRACVSVLPLRAAAPPSPRTHAASGLGHQIELIAKLEAYDCLQHLDAIVQAADGIMVARGDLGAQVRGLVCMGVGGMQGPWGRGWVAEVWRAEGLSG